MEVMSLLISHLYRLDAQVYENTLLRSCTSCVVGISVLRRIRVPEHFSVPMLCIRQCRAGRYARAISIPRNKCELTYRCPL